MFRFLKKKTTKQIRSLSQEVEKQVMRSGNAKKVNNALRSILKKPSTFSRTITDVFILDIDSKRVSFNTNVKVYNVESYKKHNQAMWAKELKSQKKRLNKCTIF